jgi:adenylate cyclase
VACCCGADEDVGVAEVVPNEELRALLLGFYRAWAALDVDGFVEVFSTSPCLMLGGTAPEEWLYGADAVNVFAAQLPQMGRMAIEPLDLRAYSCGNVGWVGDNPLVTFADGGSFRGRLTATFVIERGHWHIVALHFSHPFPNARPLTTSIEEVEHLVRVDRPDIDAAHAPEGTVTVVFSDIESSTAVMERIGDTDFTRMLAWHDRIVRDSVSEHRGFVVKAQGDGFMLAFPSAAYALRACLVIRDRIAEGYHDLPIRIRAGLHAGEALHHNDDFYGRTVVIAARISALALGGEILASDLVHALAHALGTFTFGTPRTTTLKGLEGNHTVYPVLA